MCDTCFRKFAGFTNPNVYEIWKDNSTLQLSVSVVDKQKFAMVTSTFKFFFMSLVQNT